MHFQAKSWLLPLTLAGVLSGCGGGSGSDGSTSVPVVDTPGECSVASQNESLFNYLQDQYYWYQDLPSSINPGSYGSVWDLLEDVQVPQDRFSFIMTEADYQAQFTNANFVGFGFSWRLATDSKSLQVRYVYDNGDAHGAGLARGDKITAVDGVAVETLAAQVSSGATTWGNVFGASTEGLTTNFAWQKPDGSVVEQVLAKQVVDTNTVLKSQVLETVDDKKVGYVVFNRFIARGVEDLNQAFNEFVGASVDELILDLRYNGGGLVSLANQLSTQIAGDKVDGEVFVTLQYNDKHPEQDVTSLFSLGSGIGQLNLDRVVVLTTGASCSASEMVINALSPFVEVVTVGSTTCGKPVGMNPVQICDNIIFAINFETTNALGVGGYFDGLPVTCDAEDLIVGDWGSIEDPLLREGLYYLNNNQCFSRAGRGPIRELNEADFSKGPIKALNEI